MSAPRFGPSVGDAIATLRSDRGAYGADEFNRRQARAQINNIARQMEIHGAHTVAEVAARFPAVFADHHDTQENHQ